MRLGTLVIATVAGIVYANDPAPVAFDAGEWYVFIPFIFQATCEYCNEGHVSDLDLVGLGLTGTGRQSKFC
jgi:hypothetical protein